MTKDEKVERARVIRAQLSVFVHLQNREYRKQTAALADPDYLAMNRLIRARSQLTALINDLKAEGYGQRYEKAREEGTGEG